MTVPYTKPFLSIADQASHLVARGLDIGDHAAAHQILEKLGYYRISGYLYPLRKSTVTLVDGKLTTLVESAFRAGATLDHAVKIAEFDRRLRCLFLEATDRIEIAMRVAVALMLGARDPWGHRDDSQFHASFTTKPSKKTGETPFSSWLRRLDDHESRSKEQFSKHFREKYDGPLPVWISIEVWDFGMMSQLVGGMTVADQTALSTQFNLGRREMLPSWLRAINHIRNVCAHHSRLWNRSPSDQATPPRTGEIPLLEHLVADPFAHSRIYAVAAPMQYLLRLIDREAAFAWSASLQALIAQFPSENSVTIDQSGFPMGWEKLDLWESSAPKVTEDEDPRSQSPVTPGPGS
jgi:abortive infection bacteriophage resistance protein